ncbi:MAG: TRAP transporter substrate-binding protein DctP [Verrucomicrobia bacterium]|nr:TRAP transporter substrate-binding protein DctP [Verrucomicrobiota bacterium]
MQPISRRLFFRLALAAIFLAFVASSRSVVQAAEKKLTIKLATLAPTGTSYHKSLLAMREKWKQATDSAVDLNVYADGKLGGESDMVNLMGINSVQAALLTAVGMAEIEPAVTGLQSMPMMFHNLAEVDYVGEKMQPMLEKRLLAKGFVVLFWVDSGWVRFFSKRPLQTPDDLRKMKLFSWAGNTAQVEIYKEGRFNPVAIETADILPSLQTGLIDAVPMPPFFALAGQMDSRAPHMLELNWAPLVGAAVVTKKAWEKIPESARAALLKSSAEAGKEIKARGRAESDESVAAMQKRGLTVHKVAPEVELEWRKAAETLNPLIRGKIVPPEIFDEVQRLLKEFRAGRK